jgi:hypothetical protein
VWLLAVSVVLSQPSSFIAAGAVVPAGATIKGGHLWSGNPAKAARPLLVNSPLAPLPCSLQPPCTIRINRFAHAAHASLLSAVGPPHWSQPTDFAQLVKQADEYVKLADVHSSNFKA